MSIEEELAPILSRRSTPSLSGPPPTEAEIDAMLAAAATVPDHGRMRPWRFVVVVGAARHPFGDALREAARVSDPTLGEAALQRYHDKAFLGPALIAVAARPRPNEKVPDWEQVASAACAGYAIALAAHLLGLGAIWKSTVFPDGARLREVLDLEEGASLLGWVNVGQIASPAPPRPPVDMDTIVRRLDDEGRPHPHLAGAPPVGR